MKQLRFIHTADWHADSEPNKLQKLENSLCQIVDYCKTIKVNAIILAGDIWEKKQSYSDNSGVPLVITYLQYLSRLVDFIFITKGNNSHDEPGSISLLHQLEKNIYAYEYPVCLGIISNVYSSFENVVDLLRIEEDLPEIDYIISLIPYPTKASLLIDDSIDNNNANFIDKFEQVFELIGDKTEPYSIPKIMGAHLNVQGSRLSTGQTLLSQDIMVAPSTIEKAKLDYYALGHIHLRQFFKPNMGYSGSIYNKNWGETEQKSFQVIEFEDEKMSINTVPLTSARPMVTIEAEFINKEFNLLSDLDTIHLARQFYSEVRFRFKVKENERNLITEDKFNELKKVFGRDVKIEQTIIPNERESRSEQIMNCKSLVDEVKEYAAVVEETIDDSIISKVEEVQEVGL